VAWTEEGLLSSNFKGPHMALQQKGKPVFKTLVFIFSLVRLLTIFLPMTSYQKPRGLGIQKVLPMQHDDCEIERGSSSIEWHQVVGKYFFLLRERRGGLAEEGEG